MIAGDGYLLQHFEKTESGESVAVFTPYVYFRSNAGMISATVSYEDHVEGTCRMLPGEILRDGLYRETDPFATEPQAGTEGFYMLSALSDDGQEAYNYVVFDEIEPMGPIEKVEIAYKAPTDRLSAMATTRVTSVEGATAYALQAIPLTEQGYLRMNMACSMFDPADGDQQLLVWSIPGNLTGKYEKIKMCVAAVKREGSTTILQETEWVEFSVGEDSAASDNEEKL